MKDNNMIFYADSFKTEPGYIYGDIRSSIKMTYKNEYDKEVFKKIYDLFKVDKNVKIEIISIEVDKNDNR